MGPVHARFGGRIVIIGFGSVARATLPLLRRHIAVDPRRITVLTADGHARDAIEGMGGTFLVQPLRRQSFCDVLDRHVAAGDLLLNFSVDVSSLELAEYAMRRGILYLDTCLEIWDASNNAPSERTNQVLTDMAETLRRRHPTAATAVLTHGANPGLVSHFVKQALLDMAEGTGMAGPVPGDRLAWSGLARRLGIKVIQIPEVDTQRAASHRLPGEFVSTWSIDALIGEGSQSAEVGWGSHERGVPPGPCSPASCGGRAVSTPEPGLRTRVRSWTPSRGGFEGMLFTHEEVISIARYFAADGYGPSCHYVYRPCDDTMASIDELDAGRWPGPDRRRILMDDIVDGFDELGVLLLGDRGGYWYGSHLSIDEARAAAPDNNATTLQVAAGVVAGLVWAIRHPRAGLVQPEQMDFDQVLQVARPYLGRVGGRWTDWTPTRRPSAEEDWQFNRFRGRYPADARSGQTWPPHARSG